MDGAQQEAGGGFTGLRGGRRPADEPVGAAVVEACRTRQRRTKEAFVPQLGEPGCEAGGMGIGIGISTGTGSGTSTGAFAERQIYLDSHPDPPIPSIPL
ncbi:hypothetical protein, partial [Streptomyces mirabilis]